MKARAQDAVIPTGRLRWRGPECLSLRLLSDHVMFGTTMADVDATAESWDLPMLEAHAITEIWFEN